MPVSKHDPAEYCIVTPDTETFCVRELVELPLFYSQLFESIIVKPPKDILLFGAVERHTDAVWSSGAAHFIHVEADAIVLTIPLAATGSVLRRGSCACRICEVGSRQGAGEKPRRSAEREPERSGSDTQWFHRPTISSSLHQKEPRPGDAPWLPSTHAAAAAFSLDMLTVVREIKRYRADESRKGNIVGKGSYTLRRRGRGCTATAVVMFRRSDSRDVL